jgi:pimeloyl-ACP methyl ester carboxylesterase/DNA-binding CsgD family transcriptional regulator
MRSSPSQEVRFASVPSGTRIAWARSGQGPALVRAAHWMTNVEHDLRSAVWHPFIERLGRDVALYRYDARGCGLSGKDDAPVTPAEALEELEAVVQAAGLERFALLGISTGAATAIAYAATHPERVTHLVILGGFARGLLRRTPSAKAVEYHHALLRLMEIGWGSGNPAVQQFFTTTMVPSATVDQAAALTEQQRVACDGARAAATLRLAAEVDVREHLPKLTMPVFVLHAEEDAMVPVELGRELAASIPNARFETLPTRNHVPLAGDPAFERFCEAVGTFVGARPATAPFDATPRERELLHAVAQGLDNLQIAAHLGIAEKTVRNALSKLYEKLGVEGRPQAIVRARDLGFGRD